MILQWPGLVDKRRTMDRIYKFLITITMLITTLSSHAFEYRLVAPVQEQCHQKSYVIGNALERAAYIRALAMTAAATYTLYHAWCWLQSAPSATTVIPPVAPSLPKPPQPHFLMQWGHWLYNSSKLFAAICAQQLIGNWCLSILLGDTSLKAFVHKNISYKVHKAEIEKYLKLLPQITETTERERVQCLIWRHLQVVTDKIGLLMAYILYYARTESRQETGALLEAYITITLASVAQVTAECNELATHNVEEAATVAHKKLLELLTSSINYTMSSLPIDAEAVAW